MKREFQNIKSHLPTIFILWSTTRGSPPRNNSKTRPGLIVFSFFLGSINQALSHLRSRSAQDAKDRAWISDDFATGSIWVLQSEFFAFHLIFLIHNNKTLKVLFCTFKFRCYPRCNSLETYFMWCDGHHWQFWPCQIHTNKWNCRSIEWIVYHHLCHLCVLYTLLCPSQICTLANVKYQETYQNLLVRRYISDKQISINLAADVFAFIRQRGLGRARSKVVFGDMKAPGVTGSVTKTMTSWLMYCVAVAVVIVFPGKHVHHHHIIISSHHRRDTSQSSHHSTASFEALDGLPRSLLMNLQMEVGLPILETHPLLKHLTVLGNNEISRLCEKALKEAGRTELESGKSFGRLCCVLCYCGAVSCWVCFSA